MKINLIVNYYIDKNDERQFEINTAFFNNIVNPYVDKIYVLIDNQDITKLKKVVYSIDFELFKDKIKLINTDNKRPTFNDYFIVSNKFCKSDDITVISNVDIMHHFESLEKLKTVDLKGKCFALTRWDMKDDEIENAVFFNRADSQDTWIIKGAFPIINDADFTLGIAGCDNVIAHLLSKRYIVTNPSLDIKTFHIHTTNIRNYMDGNKVVERLQPPYLTIQPSHL